MFTKRNFCAFPKKPHNNVTGRDYPHWPSEYANSQIEHNTQSSVVTTHRRKYSSEVRKQRETQKKELRTAYCASASLRRSKEIPVASEGRSEEGEVPSQKDGIDQEAGRENTTEGRVKEGKNSAVLQIMPCWTITVH